MRVIGIAGGTASGKTTVAEALQRALGDRAVTIVHDRYYRDLPAAYRHDPSTYNFDHPDALDTDRLVHDVDRLRAGAPVDLPRYDFAKHARAPDPDRVDPRPILIVEGILVLGHGALRSRFDLRVFVETPDDLRLMRRIRRDVAERGRTWDDVLVQYERTVRPMHLQHVEPTRAFADLVLDGTAPIDDSVAAIRGAVGDHA